MRINTATPEISSPELSKPGHSPGFVLLIAPSGSYRTAPYLRAAKSLNVNLLIVSNSAHSLTPEVAGGITVDFSDIPRARKTILEAIENLRVLCVLATDDSCVELTSQIAEQLKLAHNSTTAASLTHRKDLARQALKQAGCNTPKFNVINLAQAIDSQNNVEFPVVVKPLSLSGSRGVIRADTKTELVRACERIERIIANSGQSGFAQQHVLIEQYLEGAEYAVEGFVTNGEFQLLTIFDKPEPLVGPFFEETYYLTPSQLATDQQLALVKEVTRCCQAYGLTQGPVHAEVRLTNKGVFLLELAARTIGGQCGQLIEFSMHQKLEEIVIQGMCGKLPAPPGSFESAGVLMIPVKSSGILQRVEGLTTALQVPYVKDIEIHIREGYELVPLPEGSSYLGFIFAQAPCYQQTYEALRTAFQKLKFVTRPNWSITNN